MSKEITADNKTMNEETENIVISKQLAMEIYEYLNNRPRNEVDFLCKKLEKAPTVEGFNKMIKDYYSTKDE